MKKIIVNISVSTILFFTSVIIGLVSIPLGILSFFIFSASFVKTAAVIMGEDKYTSLFTPDRNGVIRQNAFLHPIKTIKIMKSNNKRKEFIREGVLLLSELESNKSYRTRSHDETKYMLKVLERKGYISNLRCYKNGTSRLLFEQLLFGNVRDIKKNKKHNMYSISFKSTDKSKNIDDIKSDLHIEESMVKKLKR